MKITDASSKVNPKIRQILILLAVLVIGGVIYWAIQPAKDSCDYSTWEELADNYAAPALPAGEKSKVYPNWYKCHKPQKGDVVLYWLGIENPQKYVRIVRAVEGDVISVQPDYLNRGWNVTVNDEYVANGEDPLFFGVAGMRPTMSLYMQAEGKRLLGAGEVIVMANSSPGFFDSGLFGLFTVGSLAGRVEIPSENREALEKVLTTLDNEKMLALREKAGVAAEAAKAAAIAEKETSKKASDSAPQAGKKGPSPKKTPAKPKPSTKKSNQ